MIRVNVATIRNRLTAVVCSIMLAALIASAGCSDSPPPDKRDDPALKASMERSMEIYKSKMQTKKAAAPAAQKKDNPKP